MVNSADLNQLFSLKGRVALVTGASSGLGKRAAMVLAQNGAEVIAIARREKELLDLKKQLGEKIKPLCYDLVNQNNFVELKEKIKKLAPSPDILIHAAGINTRQSADEITDQGWDLTLNLNVKIPFFLSQQFIPEMKKKSWGRIVLFASLQSYRAFPNGLSYGTSKGAIAQMTRAMAESWSKDGINTNAIGPGFFPTELTEVVFSDLDRKKRNADQTCVGRNGELADIDGPILFLSSESSRFVTGQVLMVDGGFTAK